MYTATDSKIFTSSGAIKSANEQVKIMGVNISGLSGDGSVSIFDATGIQADKEIYFAHVQPGVPDFHPLCYLIRNGGYVQISGTAKVILLLG